MTDRCDCKDAKRRILLLSKEGFTDIAVVCTKCDTAWRVVDEK